MKKILIPTDFSENSGDAFAYALELLTNVKTEIQIVHIIPPVSGQGNDVTVSAKLMGEMILEAEDNMESIRVFGKDFFESMDLPNITLKTFVRIGEIIPGIKRIAKELEPDMIIMGTQGANHSTLEKVIGTISTAILKKMTCPIILVPKGYKYQKIDNLIFMTSLHPADPFKLWKATQTLSPHKPLIRCLYVKPEDKEVNTKKVETFAKYIVESSPSIRTVFNIETGDKFTPVVNDYVATYDAELVVMSKSQKSVLADLFSASYTKKMVNDLTVPLLVMD